MTRCILTIITLIGITAGIPRSVAAQDSLAAAKDLYAAAAYEDALKVLGRIEEPQQKIQNAQYQVFCLIALDRHVEAERVIQRMLEADPLFAPDREEASPRVQETFERVRAQMAPRLARALYAEAKAAFERKEHDSALEKFELVLQIAQRAGETENTLLSELELLAGGFVDLARAAVAAQAPATLAFTSASPPAAPTAPGAGAAALTPAVPIVERFPPWNPYGFAGRGLQFKGKIRLQISAAGSVEAAEIVEAIHPTYDQRLLSAAASWKYEPARRGGVPVPSERVVLVNLKEQ
jgi:tetratricopeptide (TPR) repeat protein